MKRRPTICLDTTVCINAASGKYPPAEWRRVWRFIRSNFEYAILHPVLAELIIGVADGDDLHFRHNQAAVKILYAAGKKRFLPMPGQFVLSTVLGARAPIDRLYSERFDREARTVVLASSKKQLLSGAVPWPKNRRHSVGMDLHLLRDQMKKGQDAHISALEKLRRRELRVLPANEWAARALRSLPAVRIELTSKDAEMLGSVLTGAYCYERFLWNEALNGRYDFSKHRSDWIDLQLLFYLADPFIHLLTHDRKLKARIAGSPQSDRVHGYADFVKLATS